MNTKFGQCSLDAVLLSLDMHAYNRTFCKYNIMIVNTADNLAENDRDFSL